MKRDGNTISLWQEISMPILSQSSASDIYDVIIAGGGITGITTAYLLQKAGKKCLVLEAKEVGFGTTGGTTAHINNFFDAQYNQVISDFGEDHAKLLAQTGPEVITLIKQIVTEYTIDCNFEECASVVFSRDDDEAKELEKMFEATLKVGIPAEKMEVNAFPIPFQTAIKIEGQAQFHPLKYLKALSEAFVAQGGTILTGEMVTEVKEKDNKVAVQTNSATYEAQDFIWATHTVPNINRMNFLVAPYRSYVLAFTLKSGEYPDAQAEDMGDPYHYYRTQETEGQKYILVGGEDHKTGHETHPEQCFSNLEENIRQYFHVDKITNRWSSQYYRPADGLPFIGKEPGQQHLFWATGYDGNGITFGSLSGIILSDLILKGESKYEKLFDPSRLNVKAGAIDTLKESADAVFHLIADKFTAKKLNSLNEIQKEEGKTISYEGKTISVYRDAAGELHAVKSACTHMGGNVNWNAAEKTWDCPCHGARYSIDGIVLNGPATKNLEQVDMKKG